MISADVVKILDFVDPNDPIFRREGLFEGVQGGTIVRHAGASDAVNGLARWEEGVVVVVGHFVPGRDEIRIGAEYGVEDELGTYISELRIVGEASSSIRYSPLGVKKSLSLTSSGQMPSAIRTIQRNLLMSSPL